MNNKLNKTFLEQIIEAKEKLDIKRELDPTIPHFMNHIHKFAPNNGTIPLVGYGGGHRGYNNVMQ